MEKNKTTIREIADTAGVSITTVSRVFNKSGYVNQRTREKVEKAIADLHFKPDIHARKMRGISTNIIALVIPDILNVYYTSLAKEIERELRQRGFTMVLGITQDESETFIECLAKFNEMHVDGIIYTPPPDDSSSSYIRSLIYKGIPIIELNRRREIDLFDGVEVDNFGAICQAMNYLFSLNHKNIGFVVGSKSTTTGIKRLEGYQYSMSQHGLEIDPQLVKIGQFTREHGEQATRDLLKIKGNQAPSAIFATSNRLLTGTMSVLREKNIKIPEDISVIAMDDAEWLELFSPTITTVDVAIEEMAKLSVDLLMHRIDNKNNFENPRTYSLSTVLKVRDSCKSLE